MSLLGCLKLIGLSKSLELSSLRFSKVEALSLHPLQHPHEHVLLGSFVATMSQCRRGTPVNFEGQEAYHSSFASSL